MVEKTSDAVEDAGNMLSNENSDKCCFSASYSCTSFPLGSAIPFEASFAALLRGSCPCSLCKRGLMRSETVNGTRPGMVLQQTPYWICATVQTASMYSTWTSCKVGSGMLARPPTELGLMRSTLMITAGLHCNVLQSRCARTYVQVLLI